MLENRSYAGKIHALKAGIAIAEKNDGMGVAHGHGCDSDFPVKNGDRSRDEGSFGIFSFAHGDRDPLRLQNGSAHIDSRSGDAPPIDEQPGHADTGPGFHFDDAIGNEAVLEGVPGHAAGGVAAHLGLGAVRIEHAHANVGLIRGKNQDEAVGTDAEMPVRHSFRQAFRVRDMLLKTIDVNVIIAAALHLGERERLCHVTSVKRRPPAVKTGKRPEIRKFL